MVVNKWSCLYFVSRSAMPILKGLPNKLIREDLQDHSEVKEMEGGQSWESSPIKICKIEKCVVLMKEQAAKWNGIGSDLKKKTYNWGAWVA